SVDSNGLRVNYEGSGELGEVGAIRANHPIPPQCKLFYFEVDIIDEGKHKTIGIGFCEKDVDLNSVHGCEDGYWGYHGGDDTYFRCSGRSNTYEPLFSTGDTIGCWLNFKNSTVFYTKNGISLGSVSFHNLKGTLHPCLGVRSQGASMEVNFGSRKFKFASNTE
ncbi:concanavalin A-like lectin/glucanase domain-containing protein, partial [Gigaspora rosea]